jgi:hypothetical protein
VFIFCFFFFFLVVVLIIIIIMSVSDSKNSSFLDTALKVGAGFGAAVGAWLTYKTVSKACAGSSGYASGVNVDEKELNQKHLADTKELSTMLHRFMDEFLADTKANYEMDDAAVSRLREVCLSLV